MAIGAWMQRQPGCTRGRPGIQCSQRRRTDRHGAPFAALAQHLDLSLVALQPTDRVMLGRVGMADVESHQLGQPQATRIQQFDQRLIAQPLEIAGLVLA